MIKYDVTLSVKDRSQLKDIDSTGLERIIEFSIPNALRSGCLRFSVKCPKKKTGKVESKKYYLLPEGSVFVESSENTVLKAEIPSGKWESLDLTSEEYLALLDDEDAGIVVFPFLQQETIRSWKLTTMSELLKELNTYDAVKTQELYSTDVNSKFYGYWYQKVEEKKYNSDLTKNYQNWVKGLMRDESQEMIFDLKKFNSVLASKATEPGVFVFDYSYYDIEIGTTDVKVERLFVPYTLLGFNKLSTFLEFYSDCLFTMKDTDGVVVTDKRQIIVSNLARLDDLIKPVEQVKTELANIVRLMLKFSLLSDFDNGGDVWKIS